MFWQKINTDLYLLLNFKRNFDGIKICNAIIYGNGLSYIFL